MAGKAIESADPADQYDDEDDTSKSVTLDDGPPSTTAPPASGQSSLYSSAGQSMDQEGQAGLGQEGGSQPALAMMGMASIQRGVQILSAVLPGIAPVLSDLMGRLQMIIPQAVNDMGGGGMGLFGPQGGGGGGAMGGQPGGMGGQPGMGGPPMPGQAGMGGPPGGGMQPESGPPQGPPGMPPGGQPPPKRPGQ